MVKKIGCFVIFEIPGYSCAEDFYTFWIFTVDIKNLCSITMAQNSLVSHDGV